MDDFILGLGNGVGGSSGGTQQGFTEFEPKTRKQVYEAVIAGLDVELPKTIGKVVAEDTNGDPIENIALSFQLIEGAQSTHYGAPLGDYGLNMNGHEYDTLIIEVNGTRIELALNVDSPDPESMYYAITEPDKYVNIIALTEPVGEFTASVYWLTEANDMTKLAPKTNKEKYLAYMAGLYNGEPPEPKTADEYFLYKIAENYTAPSENNG